MHERETNFKLHTHIHLYVYKILTGLERRPYKMRALFLSQYIQRNGWVSGKWKHSTLKYLLGTQPCAIKTKGEPTHLPCPNLFLSFLLVWSLQRTSKILMMCTQTS